MVVSTNFAFGVTVILPVAESLLQVPEVVIV